MRYHAWLQRCLKLYIDSICYLVSAISFKELSQHFPGVTKPMQILARIFPVLVHPSLLPSVMLLFPSGPSLPRFPAGYKPIIFSDQSYSSIPTVLQ